MEHIRVRIVEDLAVIKDEIDISGEVIYSAVPIALKVVFDPHDAHRFLDFVQVLFHEFFTMFLSCQRIHKVAS